MQKFVHKRTRYAWLLMLVYLPILLAVSFHHHNEDVETLTAVYCYDCTHGIHHEGHLTGHHEAQFCALCALQNFIYTTPNVVLLTIFGVTTHIVYATYCPFIKKLRVHVFSTRAPPVVCWGFLLNNAKIRKSYGIFCQPRIAIYTQLSACILLPIFQRIKLLFHILLKPFVFIFGNHNLWWKKSINSLYTLVLSDLLCAMFYEAIILSIKAHDQRECALFPIKRKSKNHPHRENSSLRMCHP